MARLTPLGPDEDIGNAAPVLNAILADRGWVPGLYRTLARSPALLRSFVDMTTALKTDTTLPSDFRELAILVVAHELRADIQWAAHVPTALASGVAEATIAALGSGQHQSLLSPALAVRNFAVELTRQGEPDAATWMALERFLDERQLLELTLTVGFYNMVARFLRTSALALDAEYLHPPAKTPG
jgi:4-carboxymuconolactone decarboxylase